MSALKKSKVSLEDRRIEILEHFQQVLKDEGFEGASIAKIAKRVGVNPSLLIHYFPTKEEMTVELVDFILEKYETLGSQKIKSAKQPEQRLETLLDMVFGIDWISLVDSSAFYACYYLSFRNKRVKERMQKMYMRFRERILEEIKTFMDEGIIEEGDPEVSVDFIISLVEGLAFNRNISGGTQHYLEMGTHFKKRVLKMLKKDQDQVSLTNLDELKQFKKKTTIMIDQLQQQVTQLTKQIKTL